MGEKVAIDRCPSIGDLVAANDGGLSQSHKASMTAHLRQCASCRERLHQANAFVEAHAELIEDEALVSDAEARLWPAIRRSAMSADPGFFGGDFGAEYDSEAKADARFEEFQRRLHKQKQDGIHREPPARMRRWLPVAALIPLLILGVTFSRTQTVVRAESC